MDHESPSGGLGSEPVRVEERVDPRIEQTQRAVYAATLELIAEGGLREATVERIAERSGVARSTVYRRWPSLARLYGHAFQQLLRRREHVARGDTAKELADYLDDYAERLNDPVYCSVLIALIEGAWRDPELEAVRKELFDEGSSRVMAILVAGVSSGKIRADIDLHDARDAFASPFLYRSLVEHERISERDVRRHLHDILTRYGTEQP
jgi:AcrR family transcriptional regulator